MATVQDIKRRVASVKNTRKITKAMELVAAAKLRRAETRIEALRPYADRMRELTSATARATPSRGFPLLESRETEETVAILLLTGDRGLAGGFNAQVVRRGLQLEREARAEGKGVRWLVVGKKGRSTLRFRRYDIAQAWVDLTDRPDYKHAEAAAYAIAELFTSGEVDRVTMVYNHYISPLTQIVETEPLLPIPRKALGEDEEERTAYEIALEGDVIYEPEPDDHPRAAAAHVPRDDRLPRAARIGRLGARGADDGHAQRLEERGRADRRPHARHEPGAAGRDHPGDPGSRRGRGRADLLNQLRGGRVGCEDPL